MSKKQKKKTIKQTMTTSGILKSTEIKNRLLKMYRAKNPLHKDELAKEIRIIETLYLNLSEKARETTSRNISMVINWIYSKHGRESGNSEIYLKRGLIISTAFKLEKTTITNSFDIANELNRLFTSIAEQIEEKLIKPKHHYSKCLKNQNRNSFFITPTNNEEVLS